MLSRKDQANVLDRCSVPILDILVPTVWPSDRYKEKPLW